MSRLTLRVAALLGLQEAFSDQAQTKTSSWSATATQTLDDRWTNFHQIILIKASLKI